MAKAKRSQQAPTSNQAARGGGLASALPQKIGSVGPLQASAARPLEQLLSQRLVITPKHQLLRRSLLAAPQDPDELFVVPGTLSQPECAAIIQLCESAAHPALAWGHSEHPASREVAARNNDRISFESPALAATLWRAGLDRVFANIPGCGLCDDGAAGLNSHFRVYRYTAGMLFGQHYDTPAEDPHTGRTSQYTLLVYLNGGADEAAGVGPTSGAGGGPLQGGTTVFYRNKGREVAAAQPEVGMALLHTQGPRSLLHESTPVRRGIKYVLRSDVLF